AATTTDANQAADRFTAYFQELISSRRRQPREDLVTDFVRAAATHPELFTDGDLISLFIAVFAAGHGPGIALLANTVLALLRHPAELQHLREHPEWTPSAVEEGLRYDPPTQAPNPVAAVADVEIGGKTIRRGQVVSVILAAANRDPEVFPDPDRFDITRHPNRHLAFSGGEHFCLGSVLARLEGQVALAALVRNFPDLRLGCDDSELRWIPHDRFRTLARLPVHH
ncbi:MAG: cytochrome P450, partial [Verrucomicrobia bacterium]|nr:cytochrome P450 [Verrucomicrobiota bacterium]